MASIAFSSLRAPRFAMLGLIVILSNLVTPLLVSVSCNSPEHVAVGSSISAASFGDLLTEICDHWDDLAQPAMTGTLQLQPVIFPLDDATPIRLSSVYPSVLRPPICG